MIPAIIIYYVLSIIFIFIVTYLLFIIIQCL
jgi:hypothetical protein